VQSLIPIDAKRNSLKKVDNSPKDLDMVVLRLSRFI